LELYEHQKVQLWEIEGTLQWNSMKIHISGVILHEQEFKKISSLNNMKNFVTQVNPCTLPS
jgi:hypothetical protein